MIERLLFVIIVVAEYTSYHLTTTCFKIHRLIKVICILCDAATSSDVFSSRATGKAPPPIFSLVAMVAVHSCNVLVLATHEKHWLIKVVNVIGLLTFWITPFHNSSAFPVPNSVLFFIVMHTYHLIHSMLSLTVYVLEVVDHTHFDIVFLQGNLNCCFQSTHHQYQHKQQQQK